MSRSRRRDTDPPTTDWDYSRYDFTEYVPAEDSEAGEAEVSRYGDEPTFVQIVDAMPSYTPAIDETQLIPIVRDAGVRRPRRLPRERAGPPGTHILPRGAPEQTLLAPPDAGTRAPSAPAGAPPDREGRREPSVGRSSRIMAVAATVSRLTGFMRAVILAVAIGSGAVGSAYATANNVPNIIYELLIGGVLTSVVVPLLVHAQRHDGDDGLGFAQRLLTLITVVLGGATGIAILLAPLLVALYGISPHSDKGQLTTLLARLLLIEIVFYGIAAMLSAILNTRGKFGAAAWAPVLNNVIVIGTAAVFLALPGPTTLAPSTITTTQTWVLGVGTTLGIVVQALVLVPAARRIGFRWSWRMPGRESGLGEAGRLGAWVLLYVALSQIGYGVITHVANRTSTSGYAIYNNASLLFQTPYGIVGVALLTALLPRMSRAAAGGNLAGVTDDLALGSRLTAIALVPISAAYIAIGPALTLVVFAHGETTAGQAHAMGIALAWAAFGLFPYAVTLLQMRAFYAIKDARTPTLINGVMVTMRVILALLVPILIPSGDVAAGLAFVNSVSFVPGAILGEWLLRRRFGQLQTRAVLQTVLRVAIAAAVGGVLAWLALDQTYAGLGHGRASTLVGIVCGCTIGGVVALALCVWLRVPEVTSAVRKVAGRLSRA
ncbi:MAG: murein biosynthesis integral membrane protein MurJ [Mycobacteriales bacterium]